METDQYYLDYVVEKSHDCLQEDEVPVAACIVKFGSESRNSLISVATNKKEGTGDVTAHAEILAIREAAQTLGDWRLTDCVLYSTLEPCVMCAGALVNARVKRVVYGADDPKAGAVTSLYAVTEDPRLNHRLEVGRGILAEECGGLLSAFFQKLRRGRKSGPPDETKES